MMLASAARTPGKAAPLIGALWFGYLCFVIYGSLVPLDFRLIPIDQAVARFSQIALLDVGTEGRADWVANGVLYLPVGFLTTLTFTGRTRMPLFSVIAAVAALVFSLALAVGIEFAQLFFPPRTVSLNDLMAEAIGTAVGVVLASLVGPALRGLVESGLGRHHVPVTWLLWFYGLVYLAYSLFPLDFVVSIAELGAKSKSTNWGWWIAASTLSDLRWSRLAKLVAEILMALPIGLLWAVNRGSHAVRQPLVTGMVGLTLGLVIESTQYLLISGVSQGASVLTRLVGFSLGVWLFARRQSVTVPGVQASIRRYVLLAAALYLPILAGLSGWFSSPWRDVPAAVRRLATDVNFTPFFYHYYTTEAQALFSLSSVSLLYAPVGLMVWALGWHAAMALILAALLAAGIEAGKLFPTGIRPDPTNIWIGAVAAWGTVLTLRAFAGRNAPDARGGIHFAAVQRALLPLAALCLLAIWLAGFPSFRWWLGAGFLVYACALWWNPYLLFAIVPASLPLLDLAPFTGRFFLDEFDWLLVVGLAIGYARMAPPASTTKRWQIARLLAIGVAMSFAISTWRAVTPLQWPDLNAFNSYLSPFNALRIAKGALWAVLLLPLMIRAQAAGANPHRYFSRGMVAGLAGAVLVILWERASFSDLLDFAYPYRVSGPISAMHVGGAYLECYLTMGIAFLIASLSMRQRRPWYFWIAGGLLLAGSVYAVMVTYSRGGYIALVLVGVLMTLANLRQIKMNGGTVTVGVLILLVGLAAAYPVLRGDFAQSRLASIERDLAARQNHWRAALSLVSTNWQSVWFGMGTGKFPVTRYLASDPARRSAAYRLVDESGNPSLRLSGARPLFVDQIVPVKPESRYLLKLRVRSTKPGMAATLHVCHKWQLASADCQTFTLVPAGANKWSTVEQGINSGPLGADPWYARRPVKLTLQNDARGDISIDDVQLVSPAGENLLQNGNFSQGLDHWHFTSDDHLEWHVKQILLALFFDQGAFGLGIIALMVIVASARAANGAWHGAISHTELLASLTAFIAVGMFDSLVDAPRFLFLLVAVCWLALTAVVQRRQMDSSAFPGRTRREG